MYELITVPRTSHKVNDDLDLSFRDDELQDVKQGRKLIERIKDSLKQAFLHNVDVNDLLISYSDTLDKILSVVFNKFELNKYPYLCAIAVGGYGRKEQFLSSDVDLLIASKIEPIPKDAAADIERMISYLWDLKLDLGVSVRSINATVISAREDITIITNLLETHFICGHKDVYTNLLDSVYSDNFWVGLKFLKAKVSEQNERYHQYRDTVYSIEPDIKNNPGGLRDMQLISWLAILHFKARSLKQMVACGLLTTPEVEEFLACRNFLFNIRYAMHINVSTKNPNRLTLDVQKSIASLLGYGQDGNGPVETMMRSLFRILRRVRELNNIALQQAEFMIDGYIGECFTEPVFLNSYFVKRGNLIDVIDNELFKNDPQKLLELFKTISERSEIENLHVNCVRALREARRNLKHYLIELPQCRKIFKQIILSKSALLKALPLMHELRILSSYMPQWERIEGLMQFDMFHLFSVDEHSIRVIKNFPIFLESTDPNFNLFKTVYRRLENPDLLNIAGLLHDISKGCGGHHALLGGREVQNFCQLHGFSAYESLIVSWVIKSHLLFSTTATRRDITDPDVIAAFARTCKDEEHLNMLYCLTVSDICATNDREWNSWKENIFRQLYHDTRQALNQSEADLGQQQKIQVQNTQRSVREIAKDIKLNDLDRYFSQFPSSYFIHYRPDEIVWHSRNILRFNQADKPLILFAQIPNIGTELFIFYRSNSPDFFGKVVYAMAMKRLNVLSAQIFLTHNSHILCTIKFQNQKGQLVDNERLSNLRKSILLGLNDNTQINSLPKVSCNIFSVQTKVKFLENEGSKHTFVEISTLDCPGLLAKIAITLGNCNCLISAARITTTGERADDFFAVTDLDGFALDNEKKEKLSEALYQALDPNLVTFI